MAQKKSRIAPEAALPMAGRDAAHLPGHWLLARLGKRVLRPGGRELTERMLTDADLTGADVLELAPGLGKTARSILARNPRSYTGVESDDSAVELSRRAVGDDGRVIRGEAAPPVCPMRVSTLCSVRRC